MKLSNKILFGFFGFIFLYLTAVFAELRITGSPNIIDCTNGVSEIVDISGVRYVEIRELKKDINVEGADRPRLEVLSLSGDILGKLTYKVSGDTLTLSSLQSKDIKSVKITVFLPKESLRGISVHHSSVSVRRFEPESLDIMQRSGYVWIRETNIGRMNLNLSASSLDISESKIDSLSVEAEGSRVNIHSPVAVVQGSIAEETSFYVTNLRQILLKKDENSRLMLN